MPSASEGGVGPPAMHAMGAPNSLRKGLAIILDAIDREPRVRSQERKSYHRVAWAFQAPYTIKSMSTMEDQKGEVIREEADIIGEGFQS